jgi:hypothetical protein
MGNDHRGSWAFDAQARANTGAVSARDFLDENRNGRMDPGEQPIEGVGFTINGGRLPVQTGANGVAYLGRLSVTREANIAVDTDMLEDPGWLPQVQGERVLLRPGTVAMLEIPVVMTSEFEGTVYRIENNRRREAGGVAIEIVDARARSLRPVPVAWMVTTFWPEFRPATMW